MAFRNIPPNGFPAIPDIEDLESVEKAVSTLITTTAGLTEDVSDLEEQKANQITIAPPFNPETTYEVGDLVYYNGLSYRCTNEHTGEWDADDFAGTTIANELSGLKSGLTNVEDKLIKIATAETKTTGASGSTVLTSQTGRHVLGVRFLNMGSGKSYVYELGQAGDTVYLHITDEAGVPLANEEITFEYVYIQY